MYNRRQTDSQGKKSERGMERWLDGITVSVDMNAGKLQEMATDREAWCCSPCGVAKSDTTWSLNNSS